MKKYLVILGATALLAGCTTEKEVKDSESAAHSMHDSKHYTNDQHALKDNTGEQDLSYPPLLKPTSKKGNAVEYELTAQKGQMIFKDGVKTNTYGYNGDFLGPSLQLIKGQQVTIKLTNKLDENTTFHWHGLEIAGDVDGGPHAEIKPGETKIIQFTVNQDAATLWYHPHPMGNTAPQVFKGLAGLLYIDDEESNALSLPNDYAVNDFPIILQDRQFVKGKLQYEDVANTMSTLGDTMMINGIVNPKMTVKNGQIRLRILNGSNARPYNLHFNNDMAFSLIATDGGLKDKAAKMTSLYLGAGERAEIIVDLAAVKENTLQLMDSATTLLPIQITGKAKKATTLAKNLKTAEQSKTYADLEPTKKITLEGTSKELLLNGKKYDMDRIDFKQEHGKTEVWEIENILNDEGAMAHPFHIHGTQFTVVSVNGEEPDESMTGLKDTITIQPNQKIRIAVSFPEKGLYMFHCHILEHEDAGMMGQIDVY